MNKSKLLCLCMLFCIAFTVKGQDCYRLVSPHFSQEDYESLPESKLEHYCQYAQSAFYKTNVLPDSAIVYSISDVVSNSTNMPLAADVEIDLNTFSVYAYSFYGFQHRHWGREIYFEIVDNEYRYLVLRPVVEIYNLADKLANDAYNANNENKK